MESTFATCLLESTPVSTGSEPTTTALLEAVIRGSSDAWNELVDRYGRLVWSVTRSFRLDEATAADVSQTVWLRLTENCERIHNPEKLASWLATTTRNEALKVVRQRQRTAPAEMMDDTPDLFTRSAEERLVDDETLAEAIDAFVQLSDDCRQLLRLLCAVPAIEYATISEMIGRPVGSIGPTRRRCLDNLRSLMTDSEGGA